MQISRNNEYVWSFIMEKDNSWNFIGVTFKGVSIENPIKVPEDVLIEAQNRARAMAVIKVNGEVQNLTPKVDVEKWMTGIHKIIKDNYEPDYSEIDKIDSDGSSVGMHKKYGQIASMAQKTFAEGQYGKFLGCLNKMEEIINSMQPINISNKLPAIDRTHVL